MILAIVNHKGGSTKTTTAATLAVALADFNKRTKVLLCDLDPQASLTATFGLDNNEHPKTLYHALLERGTKITDVKTHIRDRLDLVPANRNLAAGEVLLLRDDKEGDFYLRRALTPVRKEYAYILLDCPPNLGKLTINALVAADRVIIPVTCSFLAVKALGQLLDTIEQVRARLNPSLDIMGILLTRFSRTLHAAEVERRIREIFKGQVFKTVIGHSVRFEEAPAAGKTILDYEPSHPGAVAYRAFAKEVLQHD